MSFDTKYRPKKFEDVIGQYGTIKVLKELVRTGKVFQKSYVFAGPSGTGKTTTARILARAMLCDYVDSEGEPCNQCTSCKEILDGTSSFNFVEMDAANNSGVDTIRKIVDGVNFYTLGGKERRIYLIDEAHRLSKDAMDALLKPMEDSLPGSEDKRLVCLFCTTEPEKLRTTIKARCMTFGIREPEREEVVERLKFICDSEDIAYEEEALNMIFGHGRGHIRDMVNAVERVSRLGDVTKESTRDQLGLGAVSNYYGILLALGTNLEEAVHLAKETLYMVDPPALYTGIATAALSAYRSGIGLGDDVSFVDEELAKKVSDRHGEGLLRVADRILESNKRIDATILTCELVILHRFFAQGTFLPDSSVSTLDKSGPAKVSTKSNEESNSLGEGTPDAETKTTPDIPDSRELMQEYPEIFGSLTQFTEPLSPKDRGTPPEDDEADTPIPTTVLERNLSEGEISSLWKNWSEE